MLNANFIGDGDGDGDGYPGIWLSFCDICKAAVSTLYCHTHSGYFCNSCDELIHADNSLALPHERVSIFTACENKPAAFSYKADAASSQLGCDADKYLNNSLALHRRDQVTVPPFPDQFYAPSTIYPTGTMFNTGEEVTALTVDEHQTDSWLLLEPETQMNTGFKFVQELSQSFGVECNSLTEYQYQDQTIHEQLYRSLEVDSELNAMVPPVQTIEEKEKERLQKKQTDYFDRKYEASKAAVSNTTSSSQTVPMSGILAEATASDISSSYTRYPQRTTDLPKISFLIPLQFTQETREEKVLRYREKKKARRFEKKIRYASRKAYAEARPRVNGRFAKKSEVDFEADEMFSTEESG